jgi:hypothetical protein
LPLNRLANKLYGPYLDGFSATQHKYGSVAPIRAALARLKQKR